MRIHVLAAAVMVSTAISWAVASPATAAPTCGGKEATWVGTRGPDTFRGTPGRDVVVALVGADDIWGMGGDDVLCGGPGNDGIHGGQGHDRIFGGLGADTLTGDLGNDTQYAGRSDHDVFIADAGRDRMVSRGYWATVSYINAPWSVRVDLYRGHSRRWGFDTIVGVHRLIGSPFDDYLRGTDGDDMLDGAGGADDLVGKSGDDLIVDRSPGNIVLAGHGEDVVRGEGEGTVLRGGPDDDYIEALFGATASGLGGDDEISVHRGAAEVHAGRGFDTLTLTFAERGVAVDLVAGLARYGRRAHLWSVEGVVGSPYADRLLGDHRDNVLHGGAGDDSLDGGDGDDTVDGGEGLDACAGETQLGCESMLARLR